MASRLFRRVRPGLAAAIALAQIELSLFQISDGMQRFVNHALDHPHSRLPCLRSPLEVLNISYAGFPRGATP
jgi:hypothetical protein